jgi:hypothetical protein
METLADILTQRILCDILAEQRRTNSLLSDLIVALAETLSDEESAAENEMRPAWESTPEQDHANISGG